MQTRQIDLVLNKLLKAQYEGTTPNTDELYLVTDDAGITSADVVNALGYTPYNATNPNRYTSNIGTVTSVNNELPDANGNVTIQTDLSGKMDTDGTNAVSSVKFADGQWVESFSLIANEVTIPTSTNDDYSLSSYLPNDNYNYEVMLEGSVTTESTSGSLCNLRVTTDVITTNPVYVCGIRTRTASTMSNMSSVIVPVGTGRSVSVNALSSITGNYILAALAYRRIGTNT